MKEHLHESSGLFGLFGLFGSFGLAMDEKLGIIYVPIKSSFDTFSGSFGSAVNERKRINYMQIKS